MGQTRVPQGRQEAGVFFSHAPDVARQLQLQISILDALIAARDEQIVQLRRQLAGEQQSPHSLHLAPASPRADLQVVASRAPQRRAA